MRTLVGAVSFLTILQVRAKPVPPGRAAIFFPLVGAAIGGAGAAIFLGAGKILPSSLASLLTVAFWTAISGVWHEDGLAGAADAMRAGRTRERMVAILKDSRIGTFGAVAIMLGVLARWQALDHLATPRVWEALIASQAVPRAAMVAMAWISRPSGTGLGLAFSSTLSTPAALGAMAQGVAVAFLCGLRPGVLILAGGYGLIRGVQMCFYHRIGGVNGDCLGTTEQLMEIYILVLFACRDCT
ncbi:MAG TPA: adenosylcobinamide-GDP ribazoletransferase [Bryobacteraceae bacterium]|nr:adenosylcobinamide-GDP ribazoletransferase [Bryobacteraceae bacterium]